MLRVCTTEQTVSWNCNIKPTRKSIFSKKLVCVPLFLQVRLMQLWLEPLDSKTGGGPNLEPVPPGKGTESRIVSALLPSSLLPWALGQLWSRWDLLMALYLGSWLFLILRQLGGVLFLIYLLFPFKIRALLWHLQWLITNEQADKTVK